MFFECVKLTGKDTRRQLDQSQKLLDNLQSRYLAQAKTKEASSLREDAFQLHESRKAYLKASMDFCVAAPQLRMSLDKMLVKVFFDRWKDMKATRDSISGTFAKTGIDLERIRGWSREMENGERTFRKEMQESRRQIEDSAEFAAKPSRELDDYSTPLASATAPKRLVANNSSKQGQAEKQGWLNLRILTGKPTRTIWVRRWFFVKKGIFGWLVQGSRSGGVEESERIGVLLCGVRPAAQEERRFCFEVKTKDTTIMLQAESQPELVEWMNAFEIAKQKALEDPASTDSPNLGGPQALDPAFAISQPSAPEFAASAADAGMQFLSDDHSGSNFDRTTTLPIPGNDLGHAATRSSFDVSSSRRSTMVEKEGESSREQAARIIQKLDLHRKSTTTSQSGSGTSIFASSTSASGGIASLISASHNILPVGPGIIPQTSSADSQVGRTAGTNMVRNLPSSTLAPSTLAIAPTQTNLSATAVIVNGERGIGLGREDTTGGMPSGILANLWGSSNWGYINRLERGELKAISEGGKISNSLSSDIPAERSVTTSAGLIGEDQEKDPVDLRDLTPSHRRTVSLGGGDTELQRAFIAPQEFPNYYPLQLKTQDAQFRLLFPNVRRQEKVVLVFRATWNPNDHQEFPGRVYVTAKEIYFYSNHLGLVLITGISLDTIAEVTAAPGRDCDFVFLHLKDSSQEAEYTRVTIKTFLEPLSLLQRRLDFLVQNCNSEEPRDLESIMKVLIKFEHEEPKRSSSVESWDDITTLAPLGKSSSLRRDLSQRTARDFRATVLVDRGLYGEVNKEEPARFKLPSQPVVYVPRGMTRCAVDKQFAVSPKALFHVMFGDRSAVWQLLYHERRAQRVKQGPWSQQGQSHLRRTFEYDIEYLDLIRRTRQAVVMDTQMIDVLNDHLCYVVTDRKTPWHLPYNQHYMLVSKIVITHVAKSKCRLAVYTKVDWSYFPAVAKRMIEKRALADLDSDALDLADVITDQVRKLGAQSRTARAVKIFGYIGQQKQVIEFGPSDTRLTSQVRRTMGRRTLTHLVLETVGSFLEDIITSIMQWTGALLRWIWKTGSANSLILLILAASVLTNAFFSTRETSQWWQERKAGNFMARLGVGPDLVMSKAIHISDLDYATSFNSTHYENPASSWYRFQSGLIPTNHITNILQFSNIPNDYFHQLPA